jgi:hypothetical protein
VIAMPPYILTRSSNAIDYIDNERFLVVCGDITDQECDEINKGIEEDGAKTHILCVGPSAFTTLQAKLPEIKSFETGFIARNLSISFSGEKSASVNSSTLCIGEEQIIAALAPALFKEGNSEIIASSLLRAKVAHELKPNFFSADDNISDPTYENKCTEFLLAVDKELTSGLSEKQLLIEKLKRLSEEDNQDIKSVLVYILLQHFFETDSEFLPSKQVSYLLNSPKSSDLPAFEKKARLTYPNVTPIAQIENGEIIGFIRVLTNTAVNGKSYAYLSDEKKKSGANEQIFTDFLKNVLDYLNNEGYQMALIVAPKGDDTKPEHSAKVRQSYLDAGLSYANVENLHVRLRKATDAFEGRKLEALNTAAVAELRQSWENVFTKREGLRLQ